MVLEIDGFGVFRSISSHRAAFAGITADLAKVARTLVVKLIKDQRTELAALRDIRTALGSDTFKLITDGMPDSQIKSVATTLDKHNIELKASEAASQRRHFLALADGSIEPMEGSKAPQKAKAAKKPRAPPTSLERISFRSAGATRKR